MENIKYSWNINKFSNKEKEWLLKKITSFNNEEKINFIIQNDIYFYLDNFYYRTLEWGLGSGYLWKILENNIMKTFINCIIPRFSWKEPIIINKRKEKIYWYIKKYENGYVESLKIDHKKNNDFKGIIGILIDMDEWLCDISNKSCKYNNVKLLRAFIYSSMIKNWYWQSKNWGRSYEKQIDLYIFCFLYKYDKNIESVMNKINQFSYFKLLNKGKIDLNLKKVLVDNFYKKLEIILKK
jgi:hypothetical protein